MKVGVAGAAVAAKQAAKSTKTEQKTKSAKRKKEPTEEQIGQLILDHRENGRKLARSILRRWRVRMPSDEIDSIVDLALCEAARRFSEEHGASFMTFLFYHLRGHLVRAVTRAAQASNVFLSFGQHNGIDTGEWQYLNSEGLWPFAPDHFLFSQRDISTPEHELLRKERIDQCREAVTKLDDLEKEIVSRSFGDEQALVDIARSLGYSRCHISRVKKIALDRLRDLLAGATEEKERPVRQSETVTLVERTSAVARSTGARRRSRRRAIAGRERQALKAKSKAA